MKNLFISSEMILLYVNITFTVQNIGNYKNVINCQSSASVQEKLSKGMPEKRASPLHHF